MSPVSGRVRWATSWSRRAATSATRSSNASGPSDSIRPSSSHAASASSSVSFSTAHAPAAGSATRPRWDSASSRLEVLRAIRRENSSGSPTGLSKGTTVTASAPPTPAAKAATVVRSMLTQGSYLLIIGRLVTAWTRSSTGSAPLSSSTRPQSRRTARSLAIVTNWSSVAASLSSTSPAASVTGKPAASSRRRYAAAGRERPADLLHVGRALLVDRRRVDDRCEHPGPAGEPGDPTTWSPAASAPRLVPSAGVVAPSTDRNDRAWAAVAWSSTTGARSSFTPSSSAARSAPPSTSSEVAPLSRSTSACSRSAGVVRDLPASGPPGASGGGEPVDQVRRAERRDREPVEGGAGERVPHRVVGVAVAEPARLAQHRRGGALPVGAAVAVLGAGERQRPLVGLELLRLVQPSLDGLF